MVEGFVTSCPIFSGYNAAVVIQPNYTWSNINQEALKQLKSALACLNPVRFNIKLNLYCIISQTL